MSGPDDTGEYDDFDGDLDEGAFEDYSPDGAERFDPLDGLADYSKRTRTLGPSQAPQDRTPTDDFEMKLALLGRDDYANGQRLVLRAGHDLRYVHGIGWLVFDGVRWKKDESGGLLRRMSHATADAIRQEAQALHGDPKRRSDAPEHLKWRVASRSSGKLNAMQNEAQPYLEADVDDLDSHDFLFVAGDGTLELRAASDTEKMIRGRASARKDLMTLKAGVAYDPDADCPTWRAFLGQVLKDSEVRAFLQRWCGYVATGSIREQVLVICHGKGSNGKSTLMNVLAHVLGEYACGVPIATLLHDDRKRGSEASPDIVRLRGARLVMASEPNTGSRFDESTIKQLTGGERVTARDLQKSFIEFRPNFKIMLSCNTFPSIRGQDDGIWRRILIIEFTEKFSDAQKDDTLEERLKAEAAGILNWILDGYCQWRERGLQVPDAVKDRTQQYRQSQDNLGNFIAAELVVDSNASTGATKLYKAYQAWCKANGEDEISQTMFGRRMGDRGFEKVAKGTIVYRGIILRRSAEEILAEMEGSGAKQGSDPRADVPSAVSEDDYGQ